LIPKKIKFRTKIFLLIIFVCILLTAILSLTETYLDYAYKKKSTKIADQCINEIFEWENNHFVDRLGSFAELYLKAEAKNLANEVLKEYVKSGKSYEALKGNILLRNTFNNSEGIDKTNSVHIDLIYDKKTILVSIHPETEGKDPDKLLKTGVDKRINAWYKSIKNTDVQYFDYYDSKSNLTYRLYGILYVIPDTKLILSYIIEINSYIKPLSAHLIAERDSLKEGTIVALSDSYEGIQVHKLYSLIISVVVILLLSIPLILWLTTSITKPITTLRNEVLKMGKGNFNIKIAETGTVEIADLMHSFNSLGKDLVEYTLKLEKEVALREKLYAELEVARTIQESLIPHDFPNLKEFSLYAKLIPAQNVGGDFYDFFFIDKDHFCFAIGDVSGKGIPAAIFMAVTRTLLRAKINDSLNSAKIMNAMNNEILKENNQSCMFVTLFIGILNIKTNELDYCNAGHNPPLFSHCNERFDYAFSSKSCPLGVDIINSVAYKSEKIRLSPGDMLFLYTDGVTEAENKNYDLFSEDRLNEVLNDNKDKDKDLATIINKVLESVQAHAKNMEQFDDITILLLRYGSSK